MKKWHKNIALVMIAGMSLTACKEDEFLREQPYTVFSVEYFKTASGFENGIHSIYSGLRFLWGPEGMVSLGSVGTDEWALAEQARAGSPGFALTLGNYSLDAANGALLTPWNRSFNNINLANALIGFTPEVAIPEATKSRLVAEARFIRGLYYLNLVQQFGAVPLDLGSGELKFNQSPFQGFNRLNHQELLAKNYEAIIADFQFAVENLPDRRPTGAFRAAKGAALHLLAKTYIQRGYSTAKQPTDFERGYQVATELINNRSRYGTELLAHFADVFKPGNDYNQEILFSIERVPGNFGANEIGTPNSIGAGKGTDAHNDFCGDYTNVRAPLASSSFIPTSTRAIPYGRPIRRFCPTPWAYFKAFSDKTNDSRYDGSFRTMYYATTTTGPWVATLVTANGLVTSTDTAFIAAHTNAQADSLNALRNPDGTRRLKYRVVAPREFYFIGGSIDPNLTRNYYPSLSKFEDLQNIDANNQATRPFPVARLAETYLLAAEAALQTNRINEALQFINVIKTRAAYRPGLSAATVAARAERIQVRNATEITLDYILDERTRELMGECMRWPDLATRGKLLERAKKYNTDVAANIKDFHVLRPIPREQLDRTEDPDKAKYQNPGY